MNRPGSKHPEVVREPQPEEFDDVLRSADPSDVQIVEAGSGAKVTIVANATGEGAERLARIARETDPPLEDVLTDLKDLSSPQLSGALGDRPH